MTATYNNNYVCTLHTHLRLELLPLHGVVADLEDDVHVVIDAVESKVCQGVLTSGVILLPQSSKDGHPVRRLETKGLAITEGVRYNLTLRYFEES